MPVVSGSTIIRGSKGTPVAQDANDKLITVIQGSQGNDVAQDAANRLVAMMYGSAGTPVAQDAADKLIAVMQGDNGVAIAQDVANRLEAVLYGDTGVVAQDAANNLIAVMKGDFGGVLKTWKVDSEGRGEMFLNDTEDIWGNINTVGLAEAAVRMGSIDSFDRRGSVFYIDTFEDSPLKWSSSFGTGGGGTGHSVSLSNEHPYRGSGSMKIIPPNVAGDYSRAYRFIGGASVNRIGMEMNVLFYNTLNIKPSVLFRAYTGTRSILAGVRIEQKGSGGLSYLNNTGNLPHLDAAWTTFNDTFNLDTSTTYPIKFVVDLNTEKYVRCMFGGTEIDMSALTPYAANSTYCQRIQAEVYVVTSATGSMFFDDFILTIEEPA